MLLLLCANSSQAVRIEVRIHYHQRIPYMYADADGTVRGLVASVAARAFRQAGISYTWVETPPKRQLYLLQHEPGPDCMLGWFLLPEREAFAVFSHPLYRDEPMVALARADDERIMDDMPLESTLSNEDLTLLVRDGYSYGSFVDSMLAELHPDMISTTQDNMIMLMMLHSNRGDYFFIAPEEARVLMASSDFPASDFRVIHFTNMPMGNTRHLMCHPSLDGEIMDVINQQLSPF